MDLRNVPIAVDGPARLLAAYEEQVRRDFSEALRLAVTPEERAAVERAISEEVKKRVSAACSPQSLWSSR